MNFEKHIGLRIDEELLNKFKYVCKYNGRSVNGQIVFMIRKYIITFEKEHGEIEKDDDNIK